MMKKPGGPGARNAALSPLAALAAALVLASLAGCNENGTSRDGDAFDEGDLPNDAGTDQVADPATDPVQDPDAEPGPDQPIDPGPDPDLDIPDDVPPGVLHTYAPTDEVFMNPERGFHSFVFDMFTTTDLHGVRDGGNTVVQANAHLDAVRGAPITPEMLESLQAGLDAARAAGVKVALRFLYNNDFDEDAPLAWVLYHIDQLKPLLQANADVIFVMPAGFVGAWGEWHSSTNGLLDSVETQRAIIDAELDALPADRMIQLRTPLLKAGMFGSTALPEASAFDGSAAARVGHHNDCFLSSPTDWGTYPETEVEVWKAYLAEETRFLPMGGETCAVYPPRTECPTTLAEMEMLHFTYINEDYNLDVVAGWTAGGCRPEIERRLGYRFSLESAEFPETGRPGDFFLLRMVMRNEGWAAMFNPRPVILLIEGNGEREELMLEGADPRRWAPGTDATVESVLEVPSSLPPGEYRLLLWLPDEAESIRARTEYAVRLASEGVWDEALGANVLGSIQVE